ncbi:MAG: shikimate kinase AroK [Gammaproteobacteria bacterium]
MSAAYTTSRIFLVGLMGAGKTTLGKQLAKALKLKFVDSDEEIEKRTGVTIATIFDIEGEAGFRDREAAVIDELTQRDAIVLATGGGAVLREENRIHLKQRGTTVYLNATVDHLYNRTKRDHKRPLLQTADPKARLQELFDLRDPLYREIADIVLSTGKQPVKTVLQHLLEQLETEKATT